MHWNDIFQTILQALGGVTILVAALMWISKSLLTNLLSKDVEKFKSELQASSQKNIESLKTNLQIEAQRHAVEYSSLHLRRAELISELYSCAVELYQGVMSLSMELGIRQARAEHYSRYEAATAQPWEIKVGIHTLSPDEEVQAKALHQTYKEFMHFYGEKKIYFSVDVCNVIESFANTAGYMGIMYQNVAVRDDDNQPFINPLVSKTWEKMGNKLPELLATLEKEFRSLLGVNKTFTPIPPSNFNE